jgi:MinD-like ATPase involved in chromosome partitioning or flagellar assembly
MSSTPVLLALTGSALEPAVVTALQRSDRAGVQIARRCVDVADLVAAAATGRAQAALVAADLPHLDADIVAALRTHRVEPLGVVTEDPSEESQRLHRMGVGAVLVVDPSARESDDLAPRVLDCLGRATSVAAVLTTNTEEPADAPVPEPGEVVAVWGPTGAPGRSTVALGVAAELAVLGRSTLLVDADVYGGSLAQQLAILDDVSGVLAAARNARAGTLDPPALAAHCRRVGDLRVLTGLPRPDRWPELSPAAVSSVLTAARALADHVVVDCGFSLEADEDLMFDTAAPRRNGATLCVLEQADRVVAVGTADPVGLSRLARGVVDLAATVPGADVAVVVNRMRGGLGWPAEEAAALLERFTGRPVTAVLPDDRGACDRALVHGKTLAECAAGSPLRGALRDLAATLAGLPATSSSRRGRRGKVGAVS